MLLCTGGKTGTLNIQTHMSRGLMIASGFLAWGDAWRSFQREVFSPSKEGKDDYMSVLHEEENGSHPHLPLRPELVVLSG